MIAWVVRRTAGVSGVPIWKSGRVLRQWILSQAKLVRPRNASLRRPRKARIPGTDE